MSQRDEFAPQENNNEDEDTRGQKPVGRSEDEPTALHMDAAEDEPTVHHLSPIKDEPTQAGLSTGEVDAAVEASGPKASRKGLFIAAGAMGVLAVIVTVLGVIVLGGRGWENLSPSNPTATHADGISVTIMGEDNLRIRLKSIPRETFLAGEGGSEAADALAAIPPFLEMKSPLYSIESKDAAQSETAILIPNDSQPYETLDLYRWDQESGSWVFVPGHIDLAGEVIRTSERPSIVAAFQTRPVTPWISTTIEAGDVLTDQAASALNMVLPTGVTAQADGSLLGALQGGWRPGEGYAVVPVVRSSDQVALSALLNNQASLALHIQDLTSFVVGDGYNGIALDYSAVAPADRQMFASFVTELAAGMHDYDKLVVVFVPLPNNDAVTGQWDTGGYDWRALGAVSDVVIVSPGLNPDTYTGAEISQLTEWAVGEVSRYKLHLGFSAMSIVKETGGGDFAPISFDAALEPLGGVVVETPLTEGADLYEAGTELSFALGGDITDFTPDQAHGLYYYEVPGDPKSKFWIVTAQAVRDRMDLTTTSHLGGAVIYGLLNSGSDANTLTAVNQFKVNAASSVPNQILMQWTVNGASGAVLTQNAGIGTPLVWLASDGDYVVQANIVGGRVSDRGAVAIKVGEIATETPTPTKTRAAGNTNNNAATEAPPPAPPSVGGGGNPGGGFELGGQVPSSLGPAPYMQQAGMTWVKFQAKWPYVDAGTAGSYVASGHAAGFKVLLSIPGPLYPQSIDFGAYTEHLRAVAASQPDAIEVWNEMNLDREWPAGQIDPASYVNNMLAPAFNAIKSVSPNTIVIVGALAPTGFDNGTNAWSDQRYLQGLAAAGAANYANCVGAHHNSGTTSPSQRSGRSEGDHYSWYFLPTLEVTYNSIGGTLPVCITEFGYLTPDGYGPLPQAFSWGGSTTVAQQAAWLKEGADIARGLGWVRLMIIWNVGFTQYDSDPQAGYSIIRPDGSCPACDLLP